MGQRSRWSSHEWNCLKTQTQNKWTAAILCDALWTFQHSLHRTVLKGLLSIDLPHQQSWLTWSLWHINMYRYQDTRALLRADARIYMHECMLKSEYQPFLAGPWHRRGDPRNRQRSVEWARVCQEPVEGTGGKGMSGRPKERDKTFIYQQNTGRDQILHKRTFVFLSKINKKKLLRERF